MLPLGTFGFTVFGFLLVLVGTCQEALSRDLGLDLAQFGLLGAVLALGIGAGVIIAGPVVDRLPRRPVLVGASLVASAALFGVERSAAFERMLVHVLAAGFGVANFSKSGHRLIETVERLSLPVYVVFFTLAGAKLHLEQLQQVALFAVALVAVRIFAIYAGTNFGARLGKADEATRTFGWMGFVSQAGVTITLSRNPRGQTPRSPPINSADPPASEIRLAASSSILKPIQLSRTSTRIRASEKRPDSMRSMI